MNVIHPRFVIKRRKDEKNRNYIVQSNAVEKQKIYKIYLSIQFTTHQIQIQNIKMIHFGHQIEFIRMYVRIRQHRNQMGKIHLDQNICGDYRGRAIK